MNQIKTQKFTKQWWKEGIASGLIGIVLVVIAFSFIIAFIKLTNSAFSNARGQIVSDIVADGSAVYGNLKSKFNESDARSMASTLAKQNANSSSTYYAAITINENWSIVKQYNEFTGGYSPKRAYVVESRLVTSDKHSRVTPKQSTVVVLPKTAHQIALAALDNAINMANDERYGYLWDWHKYPTKNVAVINANYWFDMDCGMFVCRAYNLEGVPLSYNAWSSDKIGRENGYQYGGDFLVASIRSSLEAVGFEYMPFTSWDDLLEGDILINRSGGHTEMYAGNHATVGAHNDYNHVSGDTGTNQEVSAGINYGYWPHVFRYVGFD